MQAIDLFESLKSNPYPGRGILLGRSADNQNAVVAYFIMGRSSNSRNRIFSGTEDGIQTEAADPGKLEDPSLIIYHPVRLWGDSLIVTNGDQTDTIWNSLKQGGSEIDALRTRCYEPDGPNYTPRISGILSRDGGYQLSILKSFNGNPDCNERFFFEYDNPPAGSAHLLHTYLGDGAPLPSFEGEPRLTVLPDVSLDAFCDMLWASLNPDNRVSLYVAYRNLADGTVTSRIVNQYTKI